MRRICCSAFATRTKRRLDRPALCFTMVALLHCQGGKTPAATDPAAPAERVPSPEERAVDGYMQGYNALVEAVGKHLISRYDSAVALAEFGQTEVHLGVASNEAERGIQAAAQAFAAASLLSPKVGERLHLGSTRLVQSANAVLEQYLAFAHFFDARGAEVAPPTDAARDAEKQKLDAEWNARIDAYREARVALLTLLTAYDDDFAVQELVEFEKTRGPAYWLRKLRLAAKAVQASAREGDRVALKESRLALSTAQTAWQKECEAALAQVPAISVREKHLPERLRAMQALQTALVAYAGAATVCEAALAKRASAKLPTAQASVTRKAPSLRKGPPPASSQTPSNSASTQPSDRAGDARESRFLCPEMVSAYRFLETAEQRLFALEESAKVAPAAP